MTTIEQIYEAINPLPAMLSAKGRAQPRAKIEFEANTKRVWVWLFWKKEHAPRYDGEERIETHVADTAEAAVAKAVEKINSLPSMKDENTHAFMRDLGKLIDDGRKVGIEVDHLNPLIETMKRLSENIITHQPVSTADDIPF